MRRHQRGGTILGLILGLLVGVGAALAVAVYVTNVPVPFVNKGGVRGEAKDKAEAQRNQNWDPNSPLYGKNPARAPAAVAPAAQGVVVPEPPRTVADNAPAPVENKPAKPEVVLPDTTKPADKPADKTQVAKLDPKAGQGADPLGDLAKSRSADGTDGFQYFVQAGAFRSQSDGDAQRAKLAMMGWEARVSEREVNGRTVYRVRVGPFNKRDDADGLKGKLDGAGVDAQIVRVQR
ncbi:MULTISPECIES: SPOR domain-containing protein [Comamonas]|jgi:cell division protein FtsN|uniref:SPOR domain-containing protein n=1 Tax=Comamonas squillarum TaxID=2977320 RepID=A0ABY5ZSB2_9BURK|nr:MULTISPECIES: SPOR domain-containing protein [Comamonas]PWB17843.1 sporulation protein [Comamonas sp. JNW]UXC16813.1 SPOR domain-containing protein [Comamonas sp. PR12]